MKNRALYTLLFITFLTFPVFHTIVMAQSGSQKMHDLLTAFGESGEFNVKRGFGSDIDDTKEAYNRSFYFNEVYTTDLTQVSNPTKIFTPHLNAFFRGFSEYVDEASEIYYHDAKDSDPMINGIQVNCSGKERNWCESYHQGIKPNENVRIILFDEPDERCRLFMMTWEQRVVYDSTINTNNIIAHGEIYEFNGYKPKHAPFMAPRQMEHDEGLPDVAAPKTLEYAELLAKVKTTSDIFKHQGWNGRNAAGVVLHKLSNNYPNTLTKEQYYELLNCIQPLIDDTDNDGLKRLLGYTCYTFYKKSQIYQPTDSIPDQGHVDSGTIGTGQISKNVQFKTMMLNAGSPVTLKVKGRAPIDATKVELIRYPQMEHIDKYPVKDGRFGFTLTLPKEELVLLYTTGCQPEKQAFFTADCKEVEIDLMKGTVTGSRQNKLIADSMQHVLDLRAKEEVDSIMQIIRNNRDNILSADAIYSIFSELSLDELRPYLNESYAYYNHPLMNPVRKYAEGLEKRIAGKPCPDAELQDSKNVLHHLRQYTTGKKTLLHFWNLSIYSTKQLKRLRKIHEKYPDLQIVSIAIYQYPKNWRECVEKNQMDWVNLLAPDGWNSPIMQKFGLCSLPEYVLVGADGVIIDAPKNLDEVEKSLRVKEE